MNATQALPTNGTFLIERSFPRPGKPATEEVPALKLAKATILLPGGLGAWIKIPVRDLTVYEAEYAQYPSALHVRYTPKGKRNERGTVLTRWPRLVVYEGWGAGPGAGPEPESMLGDAKSSGVVGVQVRMSRRSAFDFGWDTEMRNRVEQCVTKPVFASFAR